MVARALLDAAPEGVQTLATLLWGIAGDDRSVDRTDRRTDHPIGLDASLVQGLVNAHLEGAKGAAALQHEHDLAG